VIESVHIETGFEIDFSGDKLINRHNSVNQPVEIEASRAKDFRTKKHKE